MLKRDTTIDDLHKKSAVNEIRDAGPDNYKLYARPYGNATLFSTVVRSDHMVLGHTTIVDGELVLDVTDIKGRTIE